MSLGCQITVTYSKVVEILFIDLGIPMTVDVTDLREFPPALLPGFTIIPPQVSSLVFCFFLRS